MSRRKWFYFSIHLLFLYNGMEHCLVTAAAAELRFSRRSDSLTEGEMNVLGDEGRFFYLLRGQGRAHLPLPGIVELPLLGGLQELLHRHQTVLIGVHLRKKRVENKRRRKNNVYHLTLAEIE